MVRLGGGSARDTLSALDQVVAAGGVVVDEGHLDGSSRLCRHGDPARALAPSPGDRGWPRRPHAGRAPRRPCATRSCRMGAAALRPHRPRPPRVDDQAERLGPGRHVRALEVVGTALRGVCVRPPTRASRSRSRSFASP